MELVTPVWSVTEDGYAGNPPRARSLISFWECTIPFFPKQSMDQGGKIQQRGEFMDVKFL